MNPQDESKFGKGATDRPSDWLTPDAPNHAEIAGVFAPAVWTEKTLEDFVTYPKRNQGATLACTVYTEAKLLSIDEKSENGQWREFSPHSLYPLVVTPGGGANGLIAAQAAAKYGMTLEVLFPTDGQSEETIRNSAGYTVDAKQVALVYKSGSPVQCNTDFDTIASIIAGYHQLGKLKGVAISVIGQNNGSWTSPFPKPPADQNNNWYHRVPVVDFGLVNGKKYLAIDNSWGEQIGYGGQQFLSEDYMPFIYGGCYNLNVPDDWQQTEKVAAPHYVWNTDLEQGASGPDVLALQTALQSLGMFPVTSVVKPTGNFWGITKQAVILFQQSFGLSPVGVVGPLTRAKLNELFGN